MISTCDSLNSITPGLLASRPFHDLRGTVAGRAGGLSKTATMETQIELTERERIRFWSRVNKNGPTPDPVKYPDLVGPCWEWTGARDAYGYGAFSFRGRPRKTHRLSWGIHRGLIPGGLCILHKCDNEPCINPDHLFLGTKKDNSQDMSRKGRSGAHQHPETHSRGDAHYSRTNPEKLARGQRHGSVTKPEKIRRGSDNGWAKLNDELVIGIRALHALGSHSYAAVARHYHISKTHARGIILRKNWTHIP